MSIFDKRINYKPYEYGHITDPLINAMWAGHWTHKEYTFESDVQDFQTKLTEQEQGVVKRAMLMISQVEVAVKSYWSSIGKLLPKPEIAEMGAVFGGIEVIHSKAYSEVLSKLGFNDDFQAILSDEIIQGRVNYLQKYNDKVYDNDKKQIAYSLTLFSIFTENLSLFSQFYTILGFNKFRIVFKDLANIVQYTSKEENLHAEGGIALLNQIRKENDSLFDTEFLERILEEADVALKAEEKIINWILQGYENEFLSKEILMTYVKRRLNESFQKLNIDKQYDLNDELVDKTVWMDEEVYASALTDFFHKTPIDYTKKMKSFSADSLF